MQPTGTEASEANEGLATKEHKEHREMNSTTLPEMNRGPRETRERPNPLPHPKKNGSFVYLEYFAVREVSLHLCSLCGLLWLTVLFSGTVSAATRYVWQGSPSPGPPYTTWATAAVTIQDAVDAAVAGDEIVVTNGVYATGGRAIDGTMTNRVAVDKPLVLRSVNGPEVTIIQGEQAPACGCSNSAIRCVYLTNDAVLSGFTLTNGAAPSGGGVFCESASALVTNCMLAGNVASWSGGGSSRGTLAHCVLTDNSAYRGGGASEVSLHDCTLTGNSANWYGGGAFGSALDHCVLTGNQAASGGGTYQSTLNNCLITGNLAIEDVEPGRWQTIANIPLMGNYKAVLLGNGQVLLVGGEQYNCSNVPCGWINIHPVYLYDPPTGQLSENGWLLHRIWERTVTLLQDGRVLLAGNGIPTELYDPQTGQSQPGSYYDSGDHPKMIQLQDGRVLAIGIATAQLYDPVLDQWVATGTPTVYRHYPVSLVRLLDGRVLIIGGDQTTYLELYDPVQDTFVPVSATIFPLPEGESLFQTSGILLQDGRVLINDVILQSYPIPTDGWRGASRIHDPSTQALTEISGTSPEPEVTGMTMMADGRVFGLAERLADPVEGPYRAVVFEPSGASGSWHDVAPVPSPAWGRILITLPDGRIFLPGRGIELLAPVLCPGTPGYPCFPALLYYPSLPDDIAGKGGGVYGGTLDNCTLAGNSARQGGGAAQVALHNCIVQFNTAVDGANYDSSSTLAYCCTTPAPGGTGNITGAPLFVDTNGWSDLRLQPNSSCIDAGNNDFVTWDTDLDGNPRILNAIVDMGAYEFVPLSPTEIVEHLIGLVTDSDLRHKRPLLASLEAALASVERGNCHSAVGQLHALMNKVGAQVSDKALATELFAGAGEVITALDCDGSPRAAAKIHSLKRHPNGNMRMEIKGQAGVAYILEGSTNLVDWKPICVVRPDENGDYDYEDLLSDKHRCRFYRVVEH